MNAPETKAAHWFRDDLKALQTDPTFVAENVILDVTEQIHVAMREKGINQVQLAERLGISRSAVSQLLKGNQNVSIRRLVEVALALGMRLSPPELVPLETIEPTPPQAEEAVIDAGESNNATTERASASPRPAAGKAQ